MLVPVKSPLILRRISSKYCGMWHSMDIKPGPTYLERKEDWKPLEYYATDDEQMMKISWVDKVSIRKF